MKNGGFPSFFVCLPEGNPNQTWIFTRTFSHPWHRAKDAQQRLGSVKRISTLGGARCKKVTCWMIGMRFYKVLWLDSYSGFKYLNMCTIYRYIYIYTFIYDYICLCMLDLLFY